MTLRGLAVVLWLGWGVVEAGAVEVLVDGKPAASARQDARAAANTLPIPFTIGPDVATSVATTRVESLGTPQRIVVATPKQTYYRRPSDARLAPAWVVDISTANPWGVWRVFISGENGGVIRLADLLRRASGDVFPTVGSVKADKPQRRRLPDLDDSGYLQNALVRVDDLTDWISLCPTDELFCSPPRTFTCAAVAHGGLFAYPNVQQGSFETCAAFDRFDQVTGYYALAHMARYFSGKVGYQPGTGLLAGQLPLPTLANVPLFANAFFAPPSDASPQPFFAFGDEFAPPQQNDFLRDPTVPRHEFTHAVVFDLDTALNDDLTCVDDCSPYIAALNEALADYFAMASFNMHPTVVGSQLGQISAQIERDLHNDFRFPCDLVGEPHTDGRIWGGFLREVRRIVGRKKADPGIFFSLKQLPHNSRSLQFADALTALLDKLALPSHKFLRVVESAVRHGLIGPSSFDRSTEDVRLSNGESAWVCLGDATCDVDTQNRVEGRSSAVIDIGDGFGVGLAAYDSFPVADLTSNTAIRLFLSDSVAAGPGDLAIVLDDSPDCSSPLKTLPIPQHGTNGFQEFTLPLGDRTGLGAVTCVGLEVLVDRGSRVLLIDDLVASSGTRFGAVVVPLDAGRHLGLRNSFPAPLGDAHFYYFRPPAGTTRVSVVAETAGTSNVQTDLRYCGNVTVGGTGIPAELNNVFLWTYDPSQPALQYGLTPLEIDQHVLITGVPTAGAQHRRLRRHPLPVSPSGIYAVSFQGAGHYRAKLIFE